MKKISTLFFLFVFLSGCAQPHLVKKVQPALGTIVEITVADKDMPRRVATQAIEKAFAEIKRVEDLLSKFKSESDISRINANAYIRPTKVSSETITLLEKTILFSQLTNGAFDITVSPLMQAWGMRDKQKKRYRPSEKELKEALDRVGYQNIDIIKQKQTVFLTHPGTSLDLGGIAKGYAVDKAIAVLREKGIKNALINAGGDIYAMGTRDEQKKWRVALQHPRKEGVTLTVLELKDKACATSGDYERYVEIEGNRYSHIINPKSGQPCTAAPASVTVLAEDCLGADALATSIFVLGPEAGVNLINQLKNTEAIVAGLQEGKPCLPAAQGQDKLNILLSQGLKGKLKFNEARYE